MRSVSESDFTGDGVARPRLLFFFPTFLAGGAELHALFLIERLRERGFPCDVLVHGPFESETTLAMPAAAGAVRLNLRGMSDPWGWVEVWRQLRRLKPDVIVAINQTPFLIAAIEKFAFATRAKCACIFHSTDMQDYEAYQETPFRLLARRFCDLLVFVGAAQARHWEARGLSARRVAVIRNGVDFSRFRASEDDRRACRARLGLGDDDFVLGMVAAFRPEKRHEDFLKALARARAMGSRAKAVLVGDGIGFEETKALAQSLGLGTACLFAGPQRDVPPFIAASDAGVLCSSVESFPLSALEFLACGRPMLISAVGGALEIVNKDHGLVHEPGDIEAFAANILRIEQPETRAALARGARASVEHFSTGAMIDAYDEAFQRLHDPS
jgi:glycosyltransferase involved in cell wall biosynthesis